MPKPVANAKRPNLQPLKRCRPKDRRTRLRKSMVPGRVGVVLIGRYTSKKVVFLKQLESGLLLCACMNNGAVRRFPQKWVLSTQQQVALSGGDGDESFFEKDSSNSAVPAEFQNSTDSLIKAVDSCVGDKYMKMYLKARFTLEKGVAAHEMVF